MSRTSSSLSQTENCIFDQSTHLFSTGNFVALHNKQMLKQLNVPIALCSAKVKKQTLLLAPEDEQLDMVVLLAVGQQVMLTTNLWVEVGLVNGALGKVVSILYNTATTPPMLPLFVVVDFVNYKGPPWDASNPTYIPILPLTRGSRRQLPLRMAWGLTIHKSQGMTLQKATIDIGNID